MKKKSNAKATTIKKSVTKKSAVKKPTLKSTSKVPNITQKILEEREQSFPGSIKGVRATNRAFRRLEAHEVFRSCDISDEFVKTHQKKQPNYEIIAQSRAVRAISVGLGVRKPGYNIYVAGVQGTGKTSVIRSFLKKSAVNQETPFDLLYVYNFKSPESPRSIEIKTGQAKRFKKDMDKLVDTLVEDIPAALQSEDYETKVNSVVNASNEKKSKMFIELEKSAKTMSFGVKSTRMGIITVPIIDGKPLSEKDYSDLTEAQKEKIETERNTLEPEVLDFARKVRAIESDTKEKLEKLRSKIGDYVVSQALTSVLKRYDDNKFLKEYLAEAKVHILENLGDFVKEDEDEGDEEEGASAGPLRKGDPYIAYRVNIFVDNTETKGAPIIIENNPTFYNLFGKIEKNIEYGIYTTDFKMIKAGALARANGGYLVLNIMDILRNQQTWDTLKRVLKNQKLYIEDLGEQYSILPTSGLRPEPISLNVKVVLIGSDWAYRMLYEMDEDFNKVFKIKADFDAEMTRDDTNISDYVTFITTRTKIENLLPFDTSAIASIIEHSSRIVDDQDKLTTRFSDIKDLTIESDFMANERKAKTISAVDVEKAIEERYFRSALVEDHMREMVARGDILISTNSRRIGEINGLAVYHMGDVAFGLPTRLTCRTYRGKTGIVNIERDASLSGRIHNKGIGILTSWIHGVFGRHAPIVLSATLCFEQSYSGVDGDSATLAELVLVLSTVGDMPLDQSIAVTGSVNQFGQIQPVGGINEKVEGFFKVCKLKGLTGRQGVIIPIQNVKHLMLNRTVRDAIDAGKFHVWPCSEVEEAFELLTGLNAGQAVEKSFTPGSAFLRIAHALKSKKKDADDGDSKTKSKAKVTKKKSKVTGKPKVTKKVPAKKKKK